MAQTVNILFFGSTSDSVIVLNALYTLQPTTYNLRLAAIVTQPARPIGRAQAITPTPVEVWAKTHTVTVLSFPANEEKPWLYKNEQEVIDALQPIKADVLVSASYGQKIPTATIQSARFGGLNVHPSILPRWRGADPVPWAILAGDHQAGVTIVTLSENFDEGKIIAQKKIFIADTDTSDPLRTKLFTLGADLLCHILPDYLSGTIKGNRQNPTGSAYARRFTRDDGFIPWEIIAPAINANLPPDQPKTPLFQTLSLPNSAETIARAFRALTPWPGVWTKVVIHGQEKRLKIRALRLHGDRLVLEKVQLEGKNPTSYTQWVQAHPDTIQ